MHHSDGIAGFGRAFMLRMAVACLLACCSTLASSSDRFPARPVILISPYQPGGTSGLIAQILAQKLSERWGQPVVIENKPGAAGAVGVSALVRAPADGHTLIAMASNALTINPLVYKSLGYNVDQDLALITRTGIVPNVLVVHPGVPARTLGELIRLLKSDPQKYVYASQGIGSNGQVTAELLFQKEGIKLQHIPYRGSAPAVKDLLSGTVHMMFDNLPSVAGLIQSDKLRALAVTSSKRSELLPDVPTVAESGYPGFETTAWFALAVSKATPEPIRRQIQDTATEVLRNPEVAAKFKAAGIQPAGEGSEYLGELVKRETELWRDVIQRANISVD